MKKLLPLVLFLGLIVTGAAQNSGEQTVSFAEYFVPAKKYLVLPVKNGAQKRNVEIWLNGVCHRYFDIELAEGQADWYAYLQIDQWKGKEVELRVDKVTKGSNVFNPIVQSDADTNAHALQEEERGQFHFSPLRGWTNDPNGMVYFNGEYHLFYQHNPYGRNWGNMTWGHAVSKDLVHWKHLDDAIHPDGGGPIFSGGAVVDSNNTSGLGKNGKAPMVMFHTGARGWGQYLSWTEDGQHFETLTEAVVPRINKDNRDPKVIWHAPTKKWVMIFWVEREQGQHSMQLLTSPDLIYWTKASTLLGGIGDDRYLFECPELYELAVEGKPGIKKWVVSGANCEYATGTFDGISFQPEQKKLTGVYGRDFYAPQTFSDVPGGRRIELGWWRTNTVTGNANFNQSMSIPLELGLKETPVGIRLTRRPVKELEILRGKKYTIGSSTLKEGSANPLANINIELAELKVELTPGKATELRLNIRGVELLYKVAAHELTVDGLKAPVALENGKLKLAVFADRTGLEIFANDGLIFMPVNINLDKNNRTLSLSAKGGPARVNGIEVYELKSIWQ